MRNILLIFILLSSLYGLSQVNAGPDQTICIGETTTLQGVGSPTFTYLWTSDPEDITLIEPTILNPEVQPLVPTDYTLEGRSVSFTNLVENGNFEDGNTGFISDYISMGEFGSIYNEGTYAVTTDAGNNHPNFNCDNDHTTGNGYFMAINGSNTPGDTVWSTTINNIDQNTEYEFSTWVASLAPASPAILQFSINGMLLGTPFQANSNTCDWYKFFEQWNSGSATSAIISIINQNTEPSGNDFSLDDIKFAKVTYYYDECTVTVNTIPTSDFDIPTQSCSADTTVVVYTGTASASATYYWDFGNATIISGSEDGPYKLQWLTSGSKDISLYVDDACSSGTTIKNINVLQSPTAEIVADQTSIPFETSTFLHGTITGNPGPLVFEWDPVNKLQNPTILDPETELLDQSTIFTLTTTDQSNMCSALDTITIFVTGGPLEILSVIAIPDTVCMGNSTDLNINIDGGSGSYESTWRSVPGGFNHVGNETQLTVSPTQTTTYYVYTFDGFTSSLEDSVKVVVLPQIDIISQPVDTLIADGQSVIFSVVAQNELTYQWQVSKNGGSSWDNILDNNTYSGSQTSQLTVTNATTSVSFFLYRCLLEGPCDPVYSSVAELIVIDSPMLIGSLEDIVSCQNDTVCVPCRLSYFIEIDSFSMDFTYDTSRLSFVNLINNYSELSSMLINHNNGSINLLWSSPSGTSLANGVFFEFCFIAKLSGVDSLKWDPESIVRNSFNIYPSLSVSSASIVIDALANAPDLASSSPDSLNILDEVDIVLDAIGGWGYDLVWTKDSCVGDTVGLGTNIRLFRPDQTTTYFAHWYNQCGSSECKQVTVKIFEQFSFAVPNAFTPNGDNLNDGFGIISPSTLPVFELYIFNRWGQIIFSTSDQYELWDGKYNGELSPQGVYIWKSKYQYRIEGNRSELHEETGTVSLIRN